MKRAISILLLLMPTLAYAQTVDVDEAQRLLDLRVHDFRAVLKPIVATTRPASKARQALLEAQTQSGNKIRQQLEIEARKLDSLMYGSNPNKVQLVADEQQKIAAIQDSLGRIERGEIAPEVFPPVAVNGMRANTIVGPIGYNKRFVEHVTISIARDTFVSSAVTHGDPVAGTAYDTRITSRDVFKLTAPLSARVVKIISDNEMLLLPFDPQPNPEAPMPIRQVLDLSNYPTEQMTVGAITPLSGPYYVAGIRSDGGQVNIEQVIPVGRPSARPSAVEFASYKSEAGAYPTDYQERVKAEFFYRYPLKDPYSAEYEFGDKPGENFGVPPSPWKRFNTDDGKWHYGWLCVVNVNGKNSFGAYSGFTPYWFFFRGGLLEDSGTFEDELP